MRALVDAAAAFPLVDASTIGGPARCPACAGRPSRPARSAPAIGRAPSRSGSTRSARAAPGSGAARGCPRRRAAPSRAASTLRATPSERRISLESPAAAEDVADDQQRPALADHLERAGDRAGLAGVVAWRSIACDRRTLGCIMQPSVRVRFVKATGAVGQAPPGDRDDSHRDCPEEDPIRPAARSARFRSEEILADLHYPAPKHRDAETPSSRQNGLAR